MELVPAQREHTQPQLGHRAGAGTGTQTLGWVWGALGAGNGTIHPAWPWADSKHWALNHPNNKDLGVQGGPRRRCWVLQPQGMVEEAEKASLNLERSCLAPGLGQHLVTNAVIVTVTPY